MSLDYAKPLNCVVNILTFADCIISYEIIDELVGITSGLPCQVLFAEQAGEQIINEETIMNLQYAMTESFVDFPKQFCFNSKITIACSKKEIKFRVPDSLRYFLYE